MIREPERIEAPFLGLLGHMDDGLRRRHSQPPKPEPDSDFNVFHDELLIYDGIGLAQ
jgi:hypothetical protein